jgi:ATP-dependent Zn protease
MIEKLTHKITKALKKFIKDLQNSSEERKTFWTYFLSILAMIIIIIIWLNFFSPIPNNQIASSTPSPQSSINFFDTLKTGFIIIYQGIINEIIHLYHIFITPNKIIITPSQ